MSSLSIIWTDHMRRVLADLQQRALLRRLQGFAEQRRVGLYAVGGTLRDICLGRPAQDVDLAMSGDVLGFSKGFAHHLGAAYVPMDAERGEARVVYRKREVIDFARFKGDTIVEDLQHRDFTINAMACPLATLLTHPAPDLIDPSDGWHDLQGSVIRMVSPMSFHEDPLRLLRAFRLAASLDFALDPTTLAAMESVVPRLAGVAPERIRGELLKLFAASRSSPHIVTMARLGLLDVLFPELAATRGIPWQPGDQGDPLDTFEYSIRTYQVVEGLIDAPGAYLSAVVEDVSEYLEGEERRALIKWAALLHAIGNAGVRREAVLAQVTDHGYPEQSARQWEQIGNRLKLSRKQIAYGRTLIGHHRRLSELATLEAQGALTLRRVHGWCKEVGRDLLGVFVLALGHALARRQAEAPLHGAIALGQCAERVWDLYQRRILPVIKARRLVTGHDLQQLFNLKPGPRFKTLLDELEMVQLEGRIHTRSEALQWVAAQLTKL
jgi:poly(A) polymerase